MYYYKNESKKLLSMQWRTYDGTICAWRNGTLRTAWRIFIFWILGLKGKHKSGLELNLSTLKKPHYFHYNSSDFISAFCTTGMDNFATRCASEMIKAPCSARKSSRYCDWITLSQVNEVFFFIMMSIISITIILFKARCTGVYAWGCELFFS